MLKKILFISFFLFLVEILTLAQNGIISTTPKNFGCFWNGDTVTLSFANSPGGISNLTWNITPSSGYRLLPLTEQLTDNPITIIITDTSASLKVLVSYSNLNGVAQENYSDNLIIYTQNTVNSGICSICQSDTSYTLQNCLADGGTSYKKPTYWIESVTGDTVRTGTINPSNTSLYTPGVIYTFNADLGCKEGGINKLNFLSSKIKIIARPYPGISETIEKCTSDAAFPLINVLGGIPTSGGVWTKDSLEGGKWTILAKDSLPGGIFYPNATPPDLYTYKITSKSTTCWDTSSVYVTKIDSAYAGIAVLNTVVCQSNTPFNLFTLIKNENLGGTWKNNVTGTVISNPDSVNLMSLSIGPNVFRYVVLSCKKDSVTSTLTVNAPISLGNITASESTFCAGTDGMNFSVTLNPNVTSYIWTYAGTGNSTLDTTHSISVNFSKTATSGYLNVKGQTGCGPTPSSSIFLMVNPLPVLSSISGNINPCESTTQAYQITNTGNSYLWSLNPTSTGTMKGPDNGYTDTIFWAAQAALHPILKVVDVINATGCKDSATLNITINNCGTFSNILSGTNIACYGMTDGKLKDTLLGGTAPFTYKWTTGTTVIKITSDSPVRTDFLTGLNPGLYNVTITDSNAYTTNDTFTIRTPSPIVRTLSSTNAICYGGTGSIFVTTSGGTGPLTSTWNPPIADTSKVKAGTYTLIVTDKNNCSALDTTITIKQPNEIIITPDLFHPLCSTISDGSIILSVTGGTGSYTYKWDGSPVATSNSLSNIPAGTHTVVVTDSLQCTATSTIVLQAKPNSITIQGTITDPSCGVVNNGSIALVVSGGNPKYTYLWTSGDTTSIISNLTDTTYSVTVTDSMGCTDSSSFSLIRQPADLIVSANVTQPLCSILADGSILLSVTGGVQPYIYVWSDSASKSNFLDSLYIGTYTVLITDSMGCSVSRSFTLTATSDVCISIPSAFSPNNDGVNDYWVIKNIGENTEISIFNRWGQTILTTKVLSAVPELNVWDGKKNGKDLPVDTYYYVITCGDGLIVRGMVTIIR